MSRSSKVSVIPHWKTGRGELFRTFHGEADHPVFAVLRDTVERCDLPITPFTDLLTGFRMDLSPATFSTFEELRTYTRHAAEPPGSSCC